MTLKLQVGEEELVTLKLQVGVKEGLVTLKLQAGRGGGASDTQTAGRGRRRGY